MLIISIFEIAFLKNKVQENFILYFYTRILSPSQLLNPFCIKNYLCKEFFRKITKIYYVI